MQASRPLFRRTRFTAHTLLVLAPLALGTTAGAHAQGTPVSQAGVRTVEFYSPAVDRTMKYNVVLPYGYDDSDLSYPVLYLLHGAGQNYTMWAGMAVPFYADMYSLIVIMPDGGNSWYVNWAESDDGQKNDWEDHIVDDVVGHVDANFRTIARREGRAITGLSMGGYGAITIGLRHPEMFVSVGSTSGALEYGRDAAARLRNGQALRSDRERSDAPNPAIDIPGFNSPAERTPRGQPFVTVDQAEAHDPFALIERVPSARVPHIYLDSGTEDPLIDVARELAGILMQKDLQFDFMQMPGRHDGAYWIQSIGRIIPVQYQVMRAALGERPVGRR
jgi:S-formylglutathione hydrolase FrmB